MAASNFSSPTHCVRALFKSPVVNTFACDFDELKTTSRERCVTPLTADLFGDKDSAEPVEQTGQRDPANLLVLHATKL